MEHCDSPTHSAVPDKPQANHASSGNTVCQASEASLDIPSQRQIIKEETLAKQREQDRVERELNRAEVVLRMVRERVLAILALC